MTTYSLSATPSAQRLDVALTILRIVIGVIFFAHGAQKLFIYTLPGTVGAFEQMGVPLAALAAPLVAFLEFLGGATLVLGLFTRIAASLLALEMLTAILLVHLPAGFFAPNGLEFPLALLTASAMLAVAGSGNYTLDALVQQRLSRHRN